MNCRGLVHVCGWCASIMLASVALVSAQGEDNDEKKDSKARLQLMQQAIAGFKVAAIDDDEAPKFASKPLLRYSDPTRGATQATVLLDAGVWRLGELGRPLALVTLEIYSGKAGDSLLSYEFLALADAELALTHKEHKEANWNSSGKALTMRELPDAPTPAATPPGRLTQMRRLARRFKATERIGQDGQDEVTCRLLPQPIDRYQSADDKMVDGALFAYANGTNPELGVLLECSATGWSYAVLRLTSAESKVELDEKEVARFAPGDFRFLHRANYAAATHNIKLK